MDIKETTFMMGNMYSDSPSGTISIPLDYHSNDFNTNHIDKTKYEHSKLNKKNYLYYKPINFEFKKSLVLYFQKYSLHIGDLIDIITRYTGIKKLVIRLTNGNCGCEARRKKFNEIFFVKLPIIKFISLSYSDMVDVALNNANKRHEQLIKNMNVKKEEELNRDQLKEQIFKNLYGNISNNPQSAIPKPPEQPKKGCGCGAKNKTHNLTKRVNIV